MHSAFSFIILAKQHKRQYFSPNRSHVSDSPANSFLYLKHLHLRNATLCGKLNYVSWLDVCGTYISVCFHSTLCSLEISHPLNRDGRRKQKQRRMRLFSGTGRRLSLAEGTGPVLCLKAERSEENRTELAWKEGAWKALQINRGVC